MFNIEIKCLVLVQLNWGIPGVFILLSNTAVPVLQLLLFFPSMAYLGANHPQLLQLSYLAGPKRVWMFFIDFLLYSLTFIANLKSLQEMTGGKIDMILAIICYNFFFSTSMIISSFTTGVCLEQFCKKVSNLWQTTNNDPIRFVSVFSEEIQLLKKVLSPILFAAFSLKCVLIISSAYVVALSAQLGVPLEIFVLVLISALWDLFYITAIVDETMDAYKSLVICLRYLSNYNFSPLDELIINISNIKLIE